MLVNLQEVFSSVEKGEAPTDIIIPTQYVKILIEYPLIKPAMVYIDSCSSKGFTAYSLLQSVDATYHGIEEVDLKHTSKYTNLFSLLQIKGKVSNGPFGVYKHPIQSIPYKCLKFNSQLNALILGNPDN